MVKDVYRVLRPKGRFYFVEHVKSEGIVGGLLQTLCEPFNRLWRDGYSSSHSTAQTIGGIFTDLYLESWPDEVDPEDPRIGIELPTLDRESGRLSSECFSVAMLCHLVCVRVRVSCFGGVCAVCAVAASSLAHPTPSSTPQMCLVCIQWWPEWRSRAMCHLR